MKTAHVATTASTVALSPFAAESGLPGGGIYVGRLYHGGDFFADWREWYRHGIVRDLNFFVCGGIGKGKTAALLTLIWRNLNFGLWSRVLDPKREYWALAEAWNEAEELMGTERYATVLRLSPNGTMRLNPLDARIAKADQQTLVTSMANSVLAAQGNPLLSSAGVKACYIALDALQRRRTRTIPALVIALLNPDQHDWEAARLTEAELRENGRIAADALDTLCVGPLRGMFDGETSSGVSLRSPLVILDLFDVFRSKAIGLLMLIADAFLQGAPEQAVNPIHEDSPFDPNGFGLYLLDEASTIFDDPGVLRGLSRDWKFCRMTGVTHGVAIHGPQTLKSVGAAGSHQAELARTLLSDSSTRIIYHTDSTQAAMAQDLFGLSNEETRHIGNLGVGRALWKVGTRPYLVEHVIGDDEWRFIDPTTKVDR